MQMNLSRQFETGEIIPAGTDWDRVLVFANGMIRIDDTVCIWFADDSMISGKVGALEQFKLQLMLPGISIRVDYDNIAYIAKKENGKWKLMREEME